MRNKKILNIVTTPFLTPKGSSLRVDALLRKLSKENYVDVITYPYGKDVAYKNTTISRVKCKNTKTLGVSEISFKKIVLDIKVFLKAYQMLREKKYDIVHCEDFEAAFIGSLLSLIFRRQKYVYDLHNTITDNLKITNKPGIVITIFELLSKFVYSRFDMVVSNWRMYLGVSNKKTFLLYDESDTNLRKISIPTKNKYLAYSGNFKRYQGVEAFLKVYAKSKSQYDVVLIGEVTGEIRKYVKDLSLEEKVFFTGVLDIQESNYILANAEYCLIPRTFGNQPSLKMIHHLMLGKVSIATNIPANLEILVDGVNSLLYSTEEELTELFKKIEGNTVNKFILDEGIKKSQKEIEYMRSYDYFIKNYSSIYDE